MRNETFILSVIIVGLEFGMLAAQPSPNSDSAALVYLNKCAGCHTVGNGNITGPDLFPVQIWPLTDLLPAIKRMEKNVGPLNDGQILMVAELLKDEKVKERIKNQEELKIKAMTAKLDPASPETGRRLFTGQAALQNNGPACSICHQVSGMGGTLGPDLSKVSERLGHTALLSACQNSAFNVMQPIYRKRPISTQEAFHLTAYLESANAQTPVSRPLLPFSLAGIGLVYAGLGLFYRGRHRPGNNFMKKRKG